MGIISPCMGERGVCSDLGAVVAVVLAYFDVDSQRNPIPSKRPYPEVIMRYTNDIWSYSGNSHLVSPGRYQM